MTDLDARYGRTVARSRQQRILGWSFGVFILVVMVAWVWWAALPEGQETLETRDIGHLVVDDRSIEVTFEVSVDSGTPVTCTVQALNEGYGVVGWTELDLEASDIRTTPYRITVLTTERATTGLVSECWLS